MAAQGTTSGGQRERRAGARAAIALDCSLSRHYGPTIAGRTIDLGPGGMRLRVTRPLDLDEWLDFELDADGGDPVSGQACVVREPELAVYALCFTRLGDPARRRLARLVGEPRTDATRRAAIPA